MRRIFEFVCAVFAVAFFLFFFGPYLLLLTTLALIAVVSAIVVDKTSKLISWAHERYFLWQDSKVIGEFENKHRIRKIPR